MDSTLVNILVLVASGATSVLVALIFKQLRDIAQDVKEIRADVGKHTADLARVESQMESFERRIDRIERQTENLQVNGCARRCALPES